MKIKFTESVTVPASKHEKELRFRSGSIHDLSEASAYRWVRRKLAVYYVEEKAVPTLKVGRPMMAEAELSKPKKVGRPKKVAKAEPSGKVLGVTPRNIGPALPVKGGGIWDDV
jgi:hypothetical protein